jgi:hypothetical protein
MYSSDIKVLQKKIHKVEEASFEWINNGCKNKGNNDSYMLRVELIGLKKTIEEILEREPKGT